jgi:hypothetical protein
LGRILPEHLQNIYSLAWEGKPKMRELVAFFVAGRKQWRCVASGEKGVKKIARWAIFREGVDFLFEFKT